MIKRKYSVFLLGHVFKQVIMIDERFYNRTAITGLVDILSEPKIQSLVLNKDDIMLNRHILSVNVLNKAMPSDLAFFDNIQYKSDFEKTKAGFCIVRPKFSSLAPSETVLIHSNDPYRLYALCASLLYTDKNLLPSTEDGYERDAFGAYVHKDALVEKNVQTAPNVVISAYAEIGSGTVFSAGAYIGYGTTIGRHCRIGSHVSVSHSLIGDNVVLLAGARIGEDGFGYALGVSHEAVPQLGRVILQDNVHIGANTAIDRGAIGDTVIGEGSKIDNLVQIGHNVVLGRHCVIAGNTAIAGSVEFGDYVICGGHTCVAGHLQIGSGARIAGATAVSRNIPVRQTWSGNPAKPMRQNFREIATLTKLAKKEKEAYV